MANCVAGSFEATAHARDSCDSALSSPSVLMPYLDQVQKVLSGPTNSPLLNDQRLPLDGRKQGEQLCPILRKPA
jgi:hypothetical protein